MKTMKATYQTPQCEVMHFSSLLMQDLMPIVIGQSGGGGFNDPNEMD